jgi:hypothetical protein
VHSSRFFSIVHQPSITPPTPPRPLSRNATNVAERERVVLASGLVTGAITAAAMLGFLLGVGRRAGTAFRPLNATAHLFFGTRADGVWGFDGIVTIVGCLVVLALSAIAALVVAQLAPSLRTLRAVVAAAGVALVGYFLHLYVAARAPGGLSALLSVGELRALYVMLAIALGLGMRFAFSFGMSAHRH